MEKTGQKELDFSHEFKNLYDQAPVDDDDEDPNSRAIQVKFLYEMITFVFLQGISLLMHSLTLI